jgi:hypothetical protein
MMRQLKTGLIISALAMLGSVWSTPSQAQSMNRSTCYSFRDQQQALAVAPKLTNAQNLDSDGDGIPCEWLPYSAAAVGVEAAQGQIGGWGYRIFVLDNRFSFWTWNQSNPDGTAFTQSSFPSRWDAYQAVVRYASSH